MRQIVEFPAADRATIVVEVRHDDDAEGFVRAGLGGELVEKSHRTFDDAVALLKPISVALMRALTEARPDEVKAEFGFKFSAKAGIVLTSADAEATMKVTISWKGSGGK